MPRRARTQSTSPVLWPTEENKFLGINDESKKEYTMDVVLKREYSIGGSANVEAGAGPSEGGEWRYGLNGSYKLPWDLTIDTDLTMNSHRGYDLLGQVSSLRYSINAQGRTDTWTNSMRRYALLTVSYRFNQKPKKNEISHLK